MNLRMLNDRLCLIPDGYEISRMKDTAVACETLARDHEAAGNAASALRSLIPQLDSLLEEWEAKNASDPS